MSDDNKRFSDLRWIDPPMAEVIGQRDIPPEEAQQHKERLLAHLKQIGVIQPDETPS